MGEGGGVGVLHLAVRCSNNDDGAVHVRSTCDHVLDVIGVSRAVDVGVVPVVRLVLDVRRRDRDAAFPLLGRFVDLAILEELRVALLRLSLGDGRGEGCLESCGQCCAGRKEVPMAHLAVVDMSDCT